MRQYELTYLISDKIGDNDLTAATGKINGIITHHKGKVLGEENWDRRKLAYPINKQDFATYITLNFELEPAELVKINREIRLDKEVLRSIIIVKDYGKEELKLTAEEVAETHEIEEVVGGERSFEAIEGETEESYDLMAKREDQVDSQETEELKDQKNDKVEEKEEKVEETAVKATAAEETVKEQKEPKTAKKPSKKAKTAETIEEKKEIVKEKKPAKKKAEKESSEKTEAKVEVEKSEKEMKAEAEADRLAKLDEEIEGILGEDL